MKFHAILNLEVYALVDGDVDGIEDRLKDLRKAITAAGWEPTRLKFDLRGEHEPKA